MKLIQKVAGNNPRKLKELAQIYDLRQERARNRLSNKNSLQFNNIPKFQIEIWKNQLEQSFDVWAEEILQEEKRKEDYKKANPPKPEVMKEILRRIDQLEKHAIDCFYTWHDVGGLIFNLCLTGGTAVFWGSDPEPGENPLVDISKLDFLNKEPIISEEDDRNEVYHDFIRGIHAGIWKTKNLEQKFWPDD